jgi:hypothetical protein
LNGLVQVSAELLASGLVVLILLPPSVGPRHHRPSPTGRWPGWPGRPAALGAAGQALGRDPFPLIVPCHRVLAAGGTGGFSTGGGVGTKRRLLTLVGVMLGRPPADDALGRKASR